MSKSTRKAKMRRRQQRVLLAELQRLHAANLALAEDSRKIAADRDRYAVAGVELLAVLSPFTMALPQDDAAESKSRMVAAHVYQKHRSLLMTFIGVTLAFITGCGDAFDSRLFNTDDGGNNDDAGMAGQAGAHADVAGSGGQAGGPDAALGGAAGAAATGAVGGGAAAGAGGSGSCPPGAAISKAGTFCIDKQPALIGATTQGPEVSYFSAVAACESRGMRLCTQQERESSCPGGQAPTAPPNSNDLFCAGPAGTWEWSATECTSAGHCRTPCCNTVNYPCDTNACDSTTPTSSFHCCEDI